MAEPRVHLVSATVHGRVLVRAPEKPSRDWLVGFHGQGRNARTMLATLQGVPGSDAWWTIAIQALHPFYHWRTQEVIASWMTREDRELHIADNLAYVDAALADVAREHGEPARLVLAGFSQGVAMAYRAGVIGARRASAVLAVGADVPPELLQQTDRAWPEVTIVAGERDEWYAPSRMEQDLEALKAIGVSARGVTFDGVHEWTTPVDRIAGELLAGLPG